MSLIKNFVNLALVIVGIGICFYGAVNKIYITTTVSVLLLLFIHIGLVNYRLSEACVIMVAGIVGSFTEIINLSLGFYDYAGFTEQTSFLPTWIVLLWFLIGSSARHSLSMFSSKPALIPVTALVSSVSLFAAGGLSGAFRFQPVDRLSMGFAILFWAIAISFILLVGNRFFEQTQS